MEGTGRWAGGRNIKRIDSRDGIHEPITISLLPLLSTGTLNHVDVVASFLHSLFAETAASTNPRKQRPRLRNTFL